MSVDWRQHLESRPDVCGGEWCARGTRVPVRVILDSLAEGASEAEIVRSYPTLEAVHVRATLAYAAALAREEALTPLVADADQAR